MKKVLLTLVLAGTAAFAQAQVQFGPKVGVNVATMDLGQRDDKDEAGVGSAFGLNIGVASNIKIIKGISVAPEIIFSQKGYKYASSGEFEMMGQKVQYSEEETFTSNYLEVPLLLRGTFGSVVKGYVNAGPTLSYWLNGRYIGNWTGSSGSDIQTINYDLKVKFVEEYDKIKTEDFVEVSREHANRYEMGASIGGGVMLPLAGSSLMVDARYTFAWKDIYNEMKENEKARNKMISLSVAYLFGY